jgi:tripartite ATP-independent transporter DctP family solute receptor
MHKKILIFVPLLFAAAVLSIIIVTVINSNRNNKNVIILKAADDHELTYPTTQGLVKMGELLKEWTDGRIIVQIFPLAQLGSEKETIRLTIAGEIDINRVNINPLTQIVPEFKVFSLPYIFSDVDHMHKVLDSSIGRELLEMLEPYGLIGLGYYDSGQRSFYNSKRPINCIDDFSGLKIRIQKADIMTDMILALNAVPVQLAFEEVYTALRTGVIDGAENNYPSYITKGHFEVAKYYIQDEHSRVPEIVLFSMKRWTTLSPEDRELIIKAAEESVPYQRELWQLKVEEALIEIKDAGCEIISDIDKEPFIKAMEPVYDKHAKEVLGWIERIQEIE